MLLANGAIRKTLGVREIIAAFFLLCAASPAGASVDWHRIGTVETLNAVGSGLNSAAPYLPLRFEGMSRPVYFSVDPSMKTLLVSREFIADHDLWEYRFEREINMPAAGGGVVAGDLVRFYVLMVGSQALHNVQAIICDECAETAGQSVLNRLEIQ